MSFGLHGIWLMDGGYGSGFEFVVLVLDFESFESKFFHFEAIRRACGLVNGQWMDQPPRLQAPASSLQPSGPSSSTLTLVAATLPVIDLSTCVLLGRTDYRACIGGGGFNASVLFS